jgi:hypothetical protein
VTSSKEVCHTSKKGILSKIRKKEIREVMDLKKKRDLDVCKSTGTVGIGIKEWT